MNSSNAIDIGCLHCIQHAEKAIDLQTILRRLHLFHPPSIDESLRHMNIDPDRADRSERQERNNLMNYENNYMQQMGQPRHKSG